MVERHCGQSDWVSHGSFIKFVTEAGNIRCVTNHSAARISNWLKHDTSKKLSYSGDVEGQYKSPLRHRKTVNCILLASIHTAFQCTLPSPVSFACWKPRQVIDQRELACPLSKGWHGHMLLAKCPDRHDCSNSTVAWQYKDPPQPLIFRGKKKETWKRLGIHQHGTAFTFLSISYIIWKKMSANYLGNSQVNQLHPCQAPTARCQTSSWRFANKPQCTKYQPKHDTCQPGMPGNPNDQSLQQARRESRNPVNHSKSSQTPLFGLGLPGINSFSSSILVTGMWLVSCPRRSSGMVMRGRLKQVVRGSGAVLTKEVMSGDLTLGKNSRFFTVKRYDSRFHVTCANYQEGFC